jgi:hypothetical protein
MRGGEYMKRINPAHNDTTSETTKSDKTRQLSQEQLNAIEHLLQGKSDAATAEAVGVARQTIWEWRKRNPVLIAELNRRRYELWNEARERMKALANRSLDVIERNLDSEDPRASLMAAQYVLKSTKLSGEISMSIGPTTPEDVILEGLKREARWELEDKMDPRDRMLNLFGIDEEVETLAKSRLKKAMAEAGLS